MKQEATLGTAYLSRLLKMAVVAGVESAVRVHIKRGDNLNARDDKGQTPLMLSAARNRADICKLLLAAGADAGLLDPSGRSALGIAQAARAFEAASAIQNACMPQLGERAADSLGGAAPEDPAPAANDLPTLRLVDVAAAELSEPPALAPGLQPAAAEAAWTADDDGDGFDLGGWEAEENQEPPEGDLNLSAAAFEIQSAITEHQPIDTSADWADFEAFLPDRATPLSLPDYAEARERLRLVLLRAFREGSVPHSEIEDLTLGDDGLPDAEAGALLSMVINDLGAETDERFEYWASHENFEVFVAPDEKPDEQDMVADALAFVDDLAGRRNEPLRIYQREFQRESLLTAEAEVALGQAMERGIEKALDALAAWPSGIGAVLDAARAVASGSKPLRWMSSGPQVEPAPSADVDTELELPATEYEAAAPEDESDSQIGLDAKASTDELAEFCASAELLSGFAVGANKDAPEWETCRGALATLGLGRSFIMELADSGLAGETESALAFAQAVKAYRRAREQMAVANLKLVLSIAKKYLFSGQPLDDLLQEGNIGLIKAVDRYDWRRGFKFSTYATWWIRQQVGRFVADKGKTIRLPVHVYDQTQRIAQAAHAFELRHGHAPSLEEVAAVVELPIHKVEALSRLGQETLPLDDLPNIESLIAADAEYQFVVRDPMECVEDIQLGKSVDYFLSTLKVKEENVLRMRFGIGIQEPMTLEDVGARLDVTRERIRQIEAKALQRLKRSARLERFLVEFGQTPKPPHSADMRGESHDEGNGDAPAEQGAQVTARAQRTKGSEPAALEKLLAHARVIGFTVEESPDGPDQRIWVYITETPDNHSRKIVRKLVDLGFEFRPGKGYWR